MQTFDVRPPAFRSTSTRNDNLDFSPDGASQADDNFGALMDRALTGNPRPVNRDDSNAPGENPPAASQSRPADKSKKSLRRELTKDNEAAPAPAAEQNPVSPILPHAADAQKAPDDDGTAEDAPEVDAEKSKPTQGTKKNGDASKSAATPTLIHAGTLATSPSPTQISASRREAKDSKENASPVSDADGQAGAPDATTQSDSENMEAKDSADVGENALIATDTPTKDPAALNPPSDKSVPAALPAPPSDPGGTSAAKHYMTMKKTENMPKVAESAEQDLPGNVAMGGEELPMAQKSAPHASLHDNEKATETFTVDSSAAARISPAPEAPAPVSTPAIAPLLGIDNRLRVLERTHDIVALHAMRLSQTASDSLHVVVKPGGGIQLSLELRQGEGFIEVRAALHKGDFAHLSQHWPDLQQRLEARGVRVGALDRSENFADTGNQSFQQSKQQTPDQDPLHAGAFAEFALAGSLREAPAIRAARATAYRGWETWA